MEPDLGPAQEVTLNPEYQGPLGGPSSVINVEQSCVDLTNCYFLNMNQHQAAIAKQQTAKTNSKTMHTLSWTRK